MFTKCNLIKEIFHRKSHLDDIPKYIPFLEIMEKADFKLEEINK